MRFFPRTARSARRLARWLWACGLVFCVFYVGASFLQYDSRRDQPWISGGDQMYYFVWAHSIVVDGDVDFSNQYSFAALLQGSGKGSKGGKQVLPLTPRRLVVNSYPAGPGYASLPLMYLASAASSLYGWLASVRVSPFAAIYPLAHLATQVILAFIGLAAAWTILRPRYGSRIALGAIAVVFFGTAQGYYTVLSPGYAHSAGFCMNTLFLLLALGGEKEWRAAVRGTAPLSRSIRTALGMGVLLGLSAMMRNANAHLALAPLVLAGVGAARSPQFRTGRAVGFALAALPVAAAGCLLGFLPQMQAWHQLFGAWLVDSYRYHYAGPSMVALYPYPRYGLHILFGTRVGLFLWHPLTALAAVGLVLAVRRGRALAWSGVAALLATAWIYGSWAWYDLGFPFGMRAFVDFSVFFMIGLAEVFLRLRLKRFLGFGRWVRALVVALILWNFYMVIVVRADVQPPAQPWAGLHLFTHWSRARALQLWHDIPILPEVVANQRKARLRAAAGPQGVEDPALRPTPLLFPLFTAREPGTIRRPSSQ